MWSLLNWSYQYCPHSPTLATSIEQAHTIDVSTSVPPAGRSAAFLSETITKSTRRYLGGSRSYRGGSRPLGREPCNASSGPCRSKIPASGSLSGRDERIPTPGIAQGWGWGEYSSPAGATPAGSFEPQLLMRTPCMHGNFFAMFAAPTADVQITGGDSLVWYRSGPKAQRAFCGRCGSRVAKQPDGSDRILLSEGLFGRTTGARLRRHVFAESKPDWYDLPAVE